MSDHIIKAEFEADYVIAYRFRNGLSHLVFSTDTNMTALCGIKCLSIRNFAKEKNGNKNRKGNKNDENVRYVYKVTGGSNKLMQEIETHVKSTFPIIKN